MTQQSRFLNQPLRAAKLALGQHVGMCMAHSAIGSVRMATLDRIYNNLNAEEKAQADATWAIERANINHHEVAL